MATTIRGDGSLIGKQLELNDTSYTLVGILPANFFFPIPEAELAVPLVPDADPWRYRFPASATSDRQTAFHLTLALHFATIRPVFPTFA